MRVPQTRLSSPPHKGRCGEGLGVGVAPEATPKQRVPPPSPTFPHHKSGLPDLRSIVRNPGKPGFRGGGSGAFCASHAEPRLTRSLGGVA